MLLFKKKKPSIYVRTLEAIALTLIIIALFYLAGEVLALWTRELCGNVQISDYTNGSAPAKCQELWKAGRL